MPRRKRHRLVSREPSVSIFKPAGIPTIQLEEILISVDEFEAMRLADFECMNQRKASTIMQISQPTFNRVLASARTKIAKALVQGHALRIEGGNYILSDGTGVLECIKCGNPIDMSSENKSICPSCGSTSLRWVRWKSKNRQGDNY